MGQEANCKARFGKQVSAGHAMLETDYVLFRGDFRVKIPFKSMRKVKATGAWLRIDAPEGALELDLDRLESLKPAIHPAGAIWIVHPKGVKEITQNDVMAATKAAGLVDTKVCAFSTTHTALKAVIPVKSR